MKKILAIFALVLLPKITLGEIIIPQSTTASVLLGPGPRYDSGNYSAPHELIWESTATVANWTVTAFKGIGTPSSATASIKANPTAGLRHSIKNTGGHMWELLLGPDDTNVRGNMRITAYQAGRFDLPTCEIVICATDAYHEQVNGVVSQKISDATKMIIASGAIIPASGITKPESSVRSILGDVDCNLWLEGMSTTSATPTVAIDLYAGESYGLTHWATESGFSYSYLQESDGRYKHRYKLDISDYPDGSYIGQFRCQVEGNWVASPFGFVKSATLSIDFSSLLTASEFRGAVSSASQAFEALASGHPSIFQVFQNLTEITRTIPNVSSATNLHATAGAVIAVSNTFRNPFDDIYKNLIWVYDYNEITENRGKNYLSDKTIPELETIFDASFTTVGE